MHESAPSPPHPLIRGKQTREGGRKAAAERDEGDNTIERRSLLENTPKIFQPTRTPCGTPPASLNAAGLLLSRNRQHPRAFPNFFERVEGGSLTVARTNPPQVKNGELPRDGGGPRTPAPPREIPPNLGLAAASRNGRPLSGRERRLGEAEWSGVFVSGGFHHCAAATDCMRIVCVGVC